eukprot:1572080-Amphidinium_carterae.1
MAPVVTQLLSTVSLSIVGTFVLLHEKQQAGSIEHFVYANVAASATCASSMLNSKVRQSLTWNHGSDTMPPPMQKQKSLASFQGVGDAMLQEGRPKLFLKLNAWNEL